MRRVIYKTFLIWNFDKEEKWLNEMAARGLQLVSVGFCRYVFEEGLPGEYTYRLELLENLPSHAESVQYIRFLEDTGAEHIGNILRWVYFRKKAEGKPFDLFSDIDSRLRHLKTISLLILPLLILELIIGLYNLYIYFALRTVNVNFVGGVLCLLLGILLGFGYLKVLNKKNRMKKDRLLHE